MGRSLYQLPTPFLIEQGHATRIDLRFAVAHPWRASWERAGVDIDGHARDAGAAYDALWTAHKRLRLARVRLDVVAESAQEVATAAHAWLLWLAGVVDDVAATGARPGVIVSTEGLRKHGPRLLETTRLLRGLLPDVARERVVLAAVTCTPERLDEGAVHLAALEAAVVRQRATEAARREAAAAERAARARFGDVLKAIDLDGGRIAEHDGLAPFGTVRDVLRREARRRDEAARRREAARSEAPAGDAVDVDA